ncbi:ComEC/Rec2 family competence protein [Formicincola oecophyllae]|uniref:ComEC/Rec2 family competence protein n=1 Tax=Formicincola oecophyllae TaxID=2558361 RepID=UPI001F1037AF|nr:ComEC/Rec2 family competence protein [Formicincola oecophyllae]
MRSVQRTPCHADVPLFAWAGYRQRLAHQVETMLPGQEGAIAATILTGESGGLTQATRDEFAAAGLAHILAVAGLHLALVTGLAAVVLQCLVRRFENLMLFGQGRFIVLGGSVLAGLGYVFLTGLHVPGLRALFMMAALAIGLVLGRKKHAMRSLALVALLFMVTDPVIITDLSFQMSFCAVLGLIAGFEALQPQLERIKMAVHALEGRTMPAQRAQRHFGVSLLGQPKFWLVKGARLAEGVFLLALTSLLAGLATMPATVMHFSRIQPWFVVANIVAVPLMGFWIMPLGMVALLWLMVVDGVQTWWGDFPWLAWPAEGAFWLMGQALGLMAWMAGQVASWPAATVAVRAPSGLGYWLALLALMMMCLFKAQGLGRWLKNALALTLLVGALLWPQRQAVPVALVDNTGGVAAVLGTGDGEVMPFTAYQAGPGKAMWVRAKWAEAFALPVQPLPPSCQKGWCLLTTRQGLKIVVVTKRKALSAKASFCPMGQVWLMVDLVSRVPPCTGFSRPILLGKEAWRVGSRAVMAVPKGSLGKTTPYYEVDVITARQAMGQRLWTRTMPTKARMGLPLMPSE